LWNLGVRSHSAVDGSGPETTFKEEAIMNSPHVNYARLIGQLSDGERYFLLGQREWNKLLKGVGESLGMGSEGQAEGEVRTAFQYFRKTSLVFGVAILESMVKDYYEYRAMLLEADSTVAPSTATFFQDEWVPGVKKDEPGLSPASWEHRLDKWAERRRSALPVGSTAGGNWVKAVSTVRSYCMSFAHWKVLLKAVVVRNLEMHNGGKMNPETHKHNPILPVGSRLDWDNDNGLLYGLRSALDLLNQGLNTTCGPLDPV
jgi:hypothetical protein